MDAGGEKEKQTTKKRLNIAYLLFSGFRTPSELILRRVKAFGVFFFSFSFFFSGGGWGEIFGVSGCTVASGESGAPG